MQYNEELDVFISHADMPFAVKAIIKSVNGHVFVTLNSDLTPNERLKAIKRASDIRDCDLIKEMPIVFHDY